MSEKTAVEQFADSVLSYKNPTNLNGTDYVMIPINKLEYLKEQAKEIEKERMQKVWDDSRINFLRSSNGFDFYTSFEEYYNETYGDKK